MRGHAIGHLIDALEPGQIGLGELGLPFEQIEGGHQTGGKQDLPVAVLLLLFERRELVAPPGHEDGRHGPVHRIVLRVELHPGLLRNGLIAADVDQRNPQPDPQHVMASLPALPWLLSPHSSSHSSPRYGSENR
ncbi:hypothetical protein D3C77_647850 [compost metagenome]